MNIFEHNPLISPLTKAFASGQSSPASQSMVMDKSAKLTNIIEQDNNEIPVRTENTRQEHCSGIKCGCDCWIKFRWRE